VILHVNLKGESSQKKSASKKNNRRTRPKLATVRAAELADQHFMAHRSGIFALVKTHLSPAGKPLFKLIENAVHAMRSLPTALLFHTVTHLLLDGLAAEAAVVRALCRHYFIQVPAHDAKARWNLLDWIGESGFLYSADWWSGVDRLQPGSASGTQAQESWHKCKLKAYLGIRTALPTLFENFEQFTRSRLHDLRASSPALPDVPRVPFPDRQLLFDVTWLTKEGRTSAHHFFRCKAYDTHEDGDTTFFAMPQTLACYDAKAACWVAGSDEPPPRANLFQLASSLAALVKARSSADFSNACQGLGLCPNPQLKDLLPVLSKHVLVVVGPYAQSFWRRQDGHGDDSTYVQGVCLFCSSFCLHGTCEHLHAAFLHFNLVSIASPFFPVKRKRRPAEDQPVQVLLPAQARPAVVSSSSAAQGSRRNPASLRRFLQHLDFTRWESVIAAEQLDLDMLATMSFADLKTALPTVPSGVLIALQREAPAWLKKD
jgi:hypothetical protein